MSSPTNKPGNILTRDPVELVTKIVIPIAGALYGGMVWVVYIVSDVYYVFLTIAGIAALSLVGAIVVWVCRNRKSELDSEILVRRFSNTFLWAVFGIVGLLSVIPLGMYAFLGDSLFDPVTIKTNLFSISTEPVEKQFLQLDILTVLYQGNKYRAAYEGDGTGNETTGASAYTFRLNVTRKSHAKRASIDTVRIRTVSYSAISGKVALRPEQMTGFQPALEFKSLVGSKPQLYPTELVHSSAFPVTRRGSIFLDDARPALLEINVFFSRAGVYKIVPEIVVNDGLTLKPFDAAPPATVVCVPLSRPQLEPFAANLPDDVNPAERLDAGDAVEILPPPKQK